MVSDNAAIAQNELCKYLGEVGWDCKKEVFVLNPLNKRSGIGYIDVVAVCDGDKIAIEFDNVSPRKKSIAKLNAFDADYKFILLRGGRKDYKVGNIYVKSVMIVPPF